MFTSFTLTAEIARRRQSEMLAQSERNHRLFRRPLAARPLTHGTLVALPARRDRTAGRDTLVA